MTPLASGPSRHRAALAGLRFPATIVTVAAAIAAIVALVVIALHAGKEVRTVMALRLPPRPGSWPDFFNIYGRNLVVSVIPLACTAGVVGLAPTQRGWRRAGDIVLAAALSVNAAMVGAAAGAYGTPLISYLIPHGPLELCALAIAGAPYLKARHGHTITRGYMTRSALGAALLLALAAALEVNQGIT